MNLETFAGLAGLFGALFIAYHIAEMFRGVKMQGIGPVENPFTPLAKSKASKPEIYTPEWYSQQGRLKITDHNGNVSYYSGRRYGVTFSGTVEDAEE